MMIEALGVKKEVTENALKGLMKQLKNEKDVYITKEEFKKVEGVENPLPNIKTAYSMVVDVEVIVPNFEKLLYIVMNYGPSSIEILEPGKITMEVGEAQSIANFIAQMIHKFVAAGAGGIVVKAE